MSNSRSDRTAPLRPRDHADSEESGGGITQPALGFVGWIRWAWRQLTSMRTALVLLLLLAVAAIPGSIVPQRSADPNGVAQWRIDNPDAFPVLDALQLFDVYGSVWFSSIYLLLFISLIGCVIPRTTHHWRALRARPPRTPARLSRLADHSTTSLVVDPADRDATAVAAVESATAQLRRSGYRVERYDKGVVASVSAERGYARETGNLVFHASLVGVLVAVGLGGGFTYTGQTVIVEGDSFVNSLGLGYNSFSPGRFVDRDSLSPYTVTLDQFDVTYVPIGQAGAGQAGDFAAHVTTKRPGEDAEQAEIRVNHPIEMGQDRIYLMGNGYAPHITVRDADGDVVFSEAVPFLPQTAQMTSLGIVKIADQLPVQVGLVGFFYPTVVEREDGTLTSWRGDLLDPLLMLDVYTGDLGINDGIPRNVYQLDTSEMEKLTGRETDLPSLQLRPGDTVDLPDGLGSITFDDATEFGARESVPRFVSLSIHHDAGAIWVLVFAVTAMIGLFAALWVPRRRVWVKATPTSDGVDIEYAALARGEDPSLAAALESIAKTHARSLPS